MIWYILIGLAVLIILGYRAVSAKPRAAASHIAQRINVKPHFVEQMITAMGSEKGRMFVEHMTTWKDHSDDDGVYTFIAYQVLQNIHEKNIRWWKSKLVENGIDPQMDYERAEIAFMYLSDSGADITRIPQFLETYNSVS